MFLGINVTVEGDKVIIEGLENYSRAISEKAIPCALKVIASGTAREALNWLSGPVRGVASRTARKSGRQRAVAQKPELAGGYPVPRVTGNLRRLLRWLDPGQSRGDFSAAPFEAIVYDSAEYARVIHEGAGSSAQFGARPFLDDAFLAFNAGDNVSLILEEKITEAKKDSGLE